ncbi:hypothetical protein NHQ30_009938 [Ciborinia camelliae]|nr:hypothetical protein NHQ30_009938 [Ciborinia camelliae]
MIFNNTPTVSTCNTLWSVKSRLSTNVMPVATNFRRFRELPTELRLRIWRFALPDQRIVLLKPCDIWIKEEQSNTNRERQLPDDHQENQVPTYRHVSIFASEHPIPTMLSACGESRMVALEHYELLFSCCDDFQDRLAFARTYFDCSVDILYLNLETFAHYALEYDGMFENGLENMDPDHLSKIQNLAIRIPDVEIFERSGVSFVAMILNYFSGLHHLHIVTCHYLLDECNHPNIETCNALHCLEKGFTAEQRADLIFTEGHIDLIRNLHQYRFNKLRPEPHPRMQYFRAPSDIKQHFIDETELGDELRKWETGYGSGGRELPTIEYQTVMTRQLAAIETSERKEYYAEVLDAQEKGIRKKHRAISQISRWTY